MRILFFLAALFVCLPGYAGEAAGRRKDGPLSVMRAGIGVMHRLSRG